MEAVGYKKLVVWQKAHIFLRAVLKASRQFPHSQEARIVRAQLLRSAMSVPANIVEGYGGQRGRSFTRYLKLSRGSAWESEYWILLAEELGAIDRRTHDEVHGLCHEVIAMLTAAIEKRGP